MKTSIKLIFVTIFLLLLSAIQANGTEKITSTRYQEISDEILTQGSTTVLIELEAPETQILQQKSISDEIRIKAVSAVQQRLAASLSATDRKRISHSYQYVPGVVMEVDEDVLQRLLKNSVVKGIYQNGRRKPSLPQSTKLVFPNQAASAFTGNNEWAVAVLDSGVDKYHSFLQTGSTQKVVSEACYSRGGYPSNYPEIDSFCPGEGYSSTAANSGLYCSGYDGCYHGTHVAGIATGDGTTFDGVARLGKIIAIQVFTGLRDYFYNDVCGIGYGQSCIVAFDSDILKGLERVYALRSTIKIASVNMSLGGGAFSSSCNGENSLVTNIISSLKKAGIATVVASGNEYYSDAIAWPACISNAIAVGATFDSGTSRDQPTSYTNESAMLDLYAPGSYINSSVPGGGYVTLEGTSMAAPHVAGAWAVLKHAKPDATVDELEKILKSVGPNVTTWNNQWIRKRLDVTSALHHFAPVSMTAINGLLLDNK